MRGALTLLMRSVRADALKRQPHAFRIGAVLFILALLIAAQADPQQVGAPGLRFFEYVSMLAAGLIALAGMGHFATAITEEKEEGTLGLLLLADISPLSILLGKSTNRILSAWLIFIAQFPFALLSLTLGGITVGQIVAAYVALGAYLFLVANLALLMSVLCRRTGEAIASMAVLLILLHGGIPYLSHLTQQLVARGRVTDGDVVHAAVGRLNDMYESTSILFAIRRIFDIRGTAGILNWQTGMSLLGGLVLFGLAWLRFRQIVWAPDASQPPRGTVPQASSRWISLVTRPWKNGLMWKDFHFIAGGPVLLLIKLVLLPAYIAVCLHFRDWIEAATGFPLMQFLQQSLLVILGVELLVCSSQLFHVEQKWGTLPTLLMLPQTAAGIGYSKAAGCLLGSVPTCLAWLAVSVAAEWGHLHQWQRLADTYAREEVVFAGCAFLVLCQLTILCSLIVKWGALPLAIAVLLIVGAVTSPLIAAAMLLIHDGYGYQDRFSHLGPVLYTTGILSAVLQFEIGRRVHLGAGQ